MSINIFHHLIISMDEKGLNTLKESIKNDTCDDVRVERTLFAILNGGDLDSSLLISNYINNVFDKIKIYKIGSAGLIPFLKFPKDRRYVHSNMDCFFHCISQNIDANLNKFEFEERAKRARRGDRIYLDLLEGLDPKFIEFMKTVLDSHQERFLYTPDFIRYGLVKKENIFG